MMFFTRSGKNDEEAAPGNDAHSRGSTNEAAKGQAAIPNGNGVAHPSDACENGGVECAQLKKKKKRKKKKKSKSKNKKEEEDTDNEMDGEAEAGSAVASREEKSSSSGAALDNQSMIVHSVIKAGFSEQQVLRAVEDMWNASLAYDDYGEIVKFLKGGTAENGGRSGSGDGAGSDVAEESADSDVDDEEVRLGLVLLIVLSPCPVFFCIHYIVICCCCCCCCCCCIFRVTFSHPRTARFVL